MTMDNSLNMRSVLSVFRHHMRCWKLAKQLKKSSPIRHIDSRSCYQCSMTVPTS